LILKQHEELYTFLWKQKKQFNGSLGCYSGHKFHIDLKPVTKLYHCKQPYSMPVDKLKLSKKEFEHRGAIDIPLNLASNTYFPLTLRLQVSNPTKIDLTLCFYTYQLDGESCSWICVIVTPFGKYW
jgi:hypothetical protein